MFHIAAEIDGKTVASKISLSSDGQTSKSQFTWSELGLVPKKEGYKLTCSASSVKSGKVFQNQAKVVYLPPTPEDVGSVVQMDGRTGALLVPGAKREPLLPFGFYTAFGGYLDQNLAVLDEIKEQGWVVFLLEFKAILIASPKGLIWFIPCRRLIMQLRWNWC